MRWHSFVDDEAALEPDTRGEDSVGNMLDASALFVSKCYEVGTVVQLVGLPRATLASCVSTC